MKNIKLSIITPCLNSDKSIAYTLSSVYSQTYKNIEHIIIDGGSKDNTINILKNHKVKKKIILAKNSSIYEAINLGIKKATGDYISVLNTDDILHNNNTLEKVVDIIKKSKEKIFLGDVVYFNNFDFNKIIRKYPAKNFRNWMFSFGLMPPHPASFISSKLAKKTLYNTNFKIAADFDLFLRLLKIQNRSFKYLNLIVTRMRTGGVSGKDIRAHITSGNEIYKSLKNNKQYNSHFLINSRYVAKLKQFFVFSLKLENFSFHKKYLKLIEYHFKIIKNIKYLNFKKNFVLSALNLAFLGSYMNDEVKIYKNLIHWPDGVFIKNININVKKIPGREILKYLKIPKEIKTITVLGNLPNISRKYLKKKYKKNIQNINLPYGDISKITKNFDYKIKKNELIMITLPTPKQEQLSEYLVSRNKNYKIICIGGSINIVSGLEKEVPKFLYPLEFIWRLRYETLRRTTRLFSTFYSYLLGKYIKKKLDNLSTKILIK